MVNWLAKYLTIFKMSWQNTFVYRLGFLAWRLRSLILLLSLYFFWLAVYQFNVSISGYSQSVMLTYIIFTSIIKAVVFSSRSNQVAVDIATGDLSNYLLKPVKYFIWMVFLDLGDKASNLFFLIFELILLLVLLKPPLFIQTSLIYLISFLVFLVLASFIYFYLNLLISLTSFWYPEHNGWPAKFLFSILVDFFCGGILPLDILPQPVFSLLKFLPSSYFLFYPLQVYLGRISGLGLIYVLGFMVFWTLALRSVVNFIWLKGLKSYQAVGR